MPRLTITLSEERHRALKESAVRRKKSIATLIEESLEMYGIKTIATAAELVARARRQSAMGDCAALALALEETRSVRKA